MIVEREVTEPYEGEHFPPVKMDPYGTNCLHHPDRWAVVHDASIDNERNGQWCPYCFECAFAAALNSDPACIRMAVDWVQENFSRDELYPRRDPR